MLKMLQCPWICVTEGRESEVEESTHSAGRRSAMETVLLRMCTTALFKIPFVIVALHRLNKRACSFPIKPSLLIIWGPGEYKLFKK